MFLLQFSCSFWVAALAFSSEKKQKGKTTEKKIGCKMDCEKMYVKNYNDKKELEVITTWFFTDRGSDGYVRVAEEHRNLEACLQNPVPGLLLSSIPLSSYHIKLFSKTIITKNNSPN